VLLLQVKAHLLLTCERRVLAFDWRRTDEDSVDEADLKSQGEEQPSDLVTGGRSDELALDCVDAEVLFYLSAKQVESRRYFGQVREKRLVLHSDVRRFAQHIRQQVQSLTDLTAAFEVAQAVYYDLTERVHLFEQLRQVARTTDLI